MKSPLKENPGRAVVCRTPKVSDRGLYQARREAVPGKGSLRALPKATLMFPYSFPGDCKGTVAIVIGMNPHGAQLEGSEVKVHEGGHSTGYLFCACQRLPGCSLCAQASTVPSSFLRFDKRGPEWISPMVSLSWQGPMNNK